jgi:hypothetical protein
MFLSQARRIGQGAIMFYVHCERCNEFRWWNARTDSLAPHAELADIDATLDVISTYDTKGDRAIPYGVRLTARHTHPASEDSRPT